MNINHERLVPGAIAYWGDVIGDINDQQDLVDYIASHGGGGGGDATWGSIQGNIENQTDLMTKLDGYATEEWVGQQGFIDSIKTVNNQSLEGTGNIEISGLTPEQEEALDPLISVETKLAPMSNGSVGYFNERNGQYLCYEVDGDVWCYPDPVNGSPIYRFNRESFAFEPYVYLKTPIDAYYDSGVIWKNQFYGTSHYFVGLSYEIDLETGDVYKSEFPNYSQASYSYTKNRHNIINIDGNNYMLSQGHGAVWSSNSLAWTEISTNIVYDYWYQSEFVYNGEVYYTYLGLHKLVLNSNGYDIEDVTSQDIPQLEGGIDLDGRRVVNVDGSLWYIGNNDTMYKLVDGVWTEVEFDFNYGYAESYPVVIGDLVFGIGLASRMNEYQCAVWNFGNDQMNVYTWMDGIYQSIRDYVPKNVASKSYVDSNIISMTDYINGVRDDLVSQMGSLNDTINQNCVQYEPWNEEPFNGDYLNVHTLSGIPTMYGIDDWWWTDDVTGGEYRKLTTYGTYFANDRMKFGRIITNYHNDPDLGELVYDDQTFYEMVSAEVPSADGTYVLKAYVADGTVGYRWEPDTQPA